jgi:hypothetical protein
MATSLTFTGTLFTSASTLNSSSQFTPVTIAQGGVAGCRVYGISAQTTSTTATGYFNLIYSSSAAGGTGIFLGTVPVLANAGNTTVAASDMFGQSVVASVFQKQKDANGVPYFNMPAGSIIQIKSSGSITTQISSPATMSIVTFGEFY